MTWYASQMSKNQRAQSLPRIRNTPPIIARSRTSRTHTTSYSKGRCVLNSVRWYANPMAPAVTNMQPMTVTELGRLFIIPLEVLLGNYLGTHRFQRAVSARDLLIGISPPKPQAMLWFL